MFINRTHRHTWQAASLMALVVMIVACPGLAAKPQQPHRILETELQAETMAFADRLASYLHQALRDYEQSPGTDNQRPLVQGDVVLTSISAFTIAADPSPATALLDMVAMVSMGRLIYEEHWLPRQGESFLPMVQAFRKAEREIWELSAKILDDDQQRTLRELINKWRADNPDQTGFAYLRFGYMASDPTASASDQKKAGGLFQSVRDATQQVEDTRLMAERTTYLATRIPLLAGGLGDYWMSDLVKNQDIKALLADVHRLSATVDQLPEMIARERSAAISQSMQEINAWSRTAIDQTMHGISAEREQALRQVFSEFNKERQNTLADMLAEEQTYSRLLAEMRDTIQAGNQLVLSANELAKMLPTPDPNETEAAPAMTIEDYRTILADVRLTLTELNSLMGGVGQTADSPALEKITQLIATSMDKAGQEGEELIDLSFKRGMLLVLFAVIALLLAQIMYSLIKRKLST